MLSMFMVKPIGIVHVDVSDDEVRDSWLTGGVEGWVEVFPEYKNGLRGLEGFSHILLVTWLHKVKGYQRKVLLVKPRRLTRFGIPLKELPLIGVFTCDSPHRPNPIGLSIVELVEIRDNVLHVRGLDLFNGTPVLDIRGYTPEYIIEKPSVPEWYKKVKKLIRKYIGRELPI